LSQHKLIILLGVRVVCFLSIFASSILSMYHFSV